MQDTCAMASLLNRFHHFTIASITNFLTYVAPVLLQSYSEKGQLLPKVPTSIAPYKIFCQNLGFSECLVNWSRKTLLPTFFLFDIRKPEYDVLLSFAF